MTAVVHTAEVTAWCREHAEKIARGEAERFHAVLADPPYELNFMGGSKKDWWDATGVAFRAETWRAIASVCHPGAFVFAFGGTRTYHKMATAMEEAGLLPHSMLVWVYACITDNARIATTRGWLSRDEVRVGDLALAFDLGSESFRWEPVEEVVEYAYDEDAFSLEGACATHVVSRNHRCVVRRGERWAFVDVEKLADEEAIPICEGVPLVRHDVLDKQFQGSADEESLFTRMRRTNCASPASDTDKADDGAETGLDPVFGMWCGEMEATRVDAIDSPAHMLHEMQRKESQRVSSRVQSQQPTAMDTGAQARVDGEDSRPRQSVMEGRRNAFQEEGQLQTDQVRALPAGFLDDGAKGRLRDGASPDRGEGDEATAAAPRVGASRGPQPDAERDREPIALRDEQGPQDVRGARLPSSDLVRVRRVAYRGTVWCVRVRSGAFVARERGIPFVTGNSGFPKATRIDTGEWSDTGETEELSDIRANHMHAGRDTSKVYVRPRREPTGEAAKWAGHRYGRQAIKPAVEPIGVFQVPYEGRPVDCITRTGAGALNIDAARVAGPEGDEHWSGDDGSDATSRPGYDGGFTKGGRPWRVHTGAVPSKGIYGEGLQGSRAVAPTTLGRWPANLALSHSESCVRVGTRRVAGSEATKRGGKMFGGSDRDKERERGVVLGYTDPDGMEEVEAWNCVEGCAVRELDAQSGERTSGQLLTHHKRGGGSQIGTFKIRDRTGEPCNFGGDEGGGARFFHNSSWDAEVYERIAAEVPFKYQSKASRSEREAGTEVPDQGGGSRVRLGNPHPT